MLHSFFCDTPKTKKKKKKKKKKGKRKICSHRTFHRLFHWILTLSRIPQLSDSALITTPGKYTVTIDLDTSVNSMSVGSKLRTSYIILVVNRDVTLNVVGRLNFVAPRFTVLGAVNVSSFDWSGRFLTGPTSPVEPRGKLTVYGSFTVTLDFSRYSSHSKYITDIDIVNQGRLEFGWFMQSYSSMSCGRCTITNSVGATLRYISGMSWYTTGFVPRADPTDGFRQGIINHGTMIVECFWYNPGHFPLDMRNYGRVVVVTMRWTSTYLFTVRHARWINNGEVEVYMTNLQIDATRFSGRGSTTLYPRPLSNKIPRGNGVGGSWEIYLSDLFANAITFNNVTLYDLRYSTKLFLSSANEQKSFTTGSLITHGRSVIEFSSSKNAFIKVTQSLTMSESSNVLHNPSSKNCSIITPPNSVSAFGFFSLSVKIGSNSSVRFHRNVILGSGSIVAGEASTITFSDDVDIPAGTSFCLRHSTLLFNGDLELRGTLNCSDCQMLVRETFRWSSGILIGKNSTLTLFSAGSLSGRNIKSLEGMQVVLNFQRPPPYGNVLVEYFNATGKRYFPKERTFNALETSFDNSSYPADFVRIENHLQARARFYGYGPLRFSSPGTLNTAASFTYGFAARMWFFLQIEEPGNYSFFVNNGYVRVRLTISDNPSLIISERPLPTPSATINTQTKSIYLSEPFVRIHYDYLVSSIAASHWANQQSVGLLYDGPGFTVKPIPLAKVSAYRLLPGGEVEYANPNSTISSINKATWSFSEGTLLGKSGPVINITESGVLSVQSDVTVVSVGDNSTSLQLVNSGEIRRELGKPGLAVFYVSLEELGGQTTILTTGLQFQDPEQHGRVILWNNAAGGNWLDPSNWNPRQVPGENDLVYVTEPGEYKVQIPGHTNVTVLSLFVGLQGSNPNLVVGFFSKVIVQDLLDVTASRLTINGHLSAANVNWAGQYLTGESSQSMLIARASLSILIGSSSSKYFSNVRVENHGNATVEASFRQSSIYCGHCQLVNAKSGTLLLHSMSFLSLSSVCQNPRSQLCIQPGLINYGHIAVQYVKHYSTYYSTSSWSGDIYNNQGTFYIINKSPEFSTPAVFKPTGVLYNAGTIKSFQVHIIFDRIRQGRTLGDIMLFDKPGTTNLLPGKDSYSHWQEYGAMFAQLDRDVSHTSAVSLQLRNIYGASIQSPIKFALSNFTGIGQGYLQVYSCRYLRLDIENGLSLDKNFVFRLNDATRHPGLVNISASGIINLGQVEIHGGWNVLFSRSARTSFSGPIFLAAKSSIGWQHSALVQVFDSVIVQSMAALRLSSGRLIAHRQVLTAGTVDFGQASVEMYGEWQWFGGTITGRSSSIKLRGGWKIYGKGHKHIIGVNIDFGLPEQLTRVNSTSAGVFVEYFQYRVKNLLNPLRQPIYSFPSTANPLEPTSMPSSFNYPSTQANYYELRSSFTQTPRTNGNAPLQYRLTNFRIDSNLEDSFTYGYASRVWAFLRVPRNGSYTFFVQSGPAIRFRLWIDGKLSWTPPWSAASFHTSKDRMSQIFPLSEGHHRLRLDMYVDRHSWDTHGNGFLLKWAGPGFNKTEIPSSLLSVKINEGGAVRFAQPAFDNASHTAWRSHFNAQFSDTMFVRTQGVANVNIGHGVVFDIQSDSSWICANLNTCKWTNSGVIRRSGKIGFAVLAVAYDNTSSGIVDQQVESLHIESQHSASFIVWNASLGGLHVWTNASNWKGGVVPGPEDRAYITLGDSSTVMIPAGVTVNVSTLIIGTSSNVNFGQLNVSHFSKLIVTNELRLHSANLNIHGELEAGHLFFSADRIVGSKKQHSTSKVVVLHSLTLSKGTGGVKTFNDIVIENYGYTTLDDTLAKNSQYPAYYCTNCQLVNHAGATMLLWGQFYRGGHSTKFEFDLVNYGTFVLASPGYHTTNYFWNTNNEGRYAIIPDRSDYMFRLDLRGTFLNQGKFDAHFTHALFFNNYIPNMRVRMNGTWQFYAQPLFQSRITLQGNNWKTYVNDMYSLSNGYSCSQPIGLTIYGMVHKDIDFGEMSFHGCNVLLFDRLQNSTIRFSRGLTQDINGKFQTQYCWQQSSVIVGSEEKTNLSFGFVNLRGACRVSALAKFIKFTSGVSLDRGSSLTLSPSKAVDFSVMSPVALRGPATLTINGGQAQFRSSFTLSDNAVLNLTESLAEFLHTLTVTGGSINGPGTVLLQRNAQIKGPSRKSLSNINVKVKPLASIPSKGIIAEYFQYRLPTSTTIQRWYLQNFFAPGVSAHWQLPSSFDNPLSKGNFLQIERTISRPSRRSGIGPSVLHPGGYAVDTSSAEAYTFNFAARLWSYLEVRSSGNYSFYVTSGYSVKCRLWIGSDLVYTASSFRHIYSPEVIVKNITLTQGFHLLRIDFLVRSARWNTLDNGLILKWSGPQVPKQEIPMSSLHLQHPDHPELTAAPAVNLSSIPACNQSSQNYYPLSYSRLLISGDGLISQTNLTVSIADKGQLDLQTSTSWPSQSRRTKLDVNGVISRTSGSGTLRLNTEFNITTGCVRVATGALDLGISSG